MRAAMRRLRVRKPASSRHRLRLLSRDLGLGETHRGLDRRQVDLLPALQPLVEARQREMGGLGRRRRARDRQPVAARYEGDAELPLDPVEMLIALAVEQRQQQIVVEFELSCALPPVRRRWSGGERAHGVADREIPERLFSTARPIIMTGTIVADPVGISGEHGRSADRGCGRRAGPRAGPAFRTAPAGPADAAVVERALLLAPAATASAASRSALTGSGHLICGRRRGVPGRGEYLNENAWAKPISPTRSSVALEILVASLLENRR